MLNYYYILAASQGTQWSHPGLRARTGPFYDVCFPVIQYRPAKRPLRTHPGHAHDRSCLNSTRETLVRARCSNGCVPVLTPVHRVWRPAAVHTRMYAPKGGYPTTGRRKNRPCE
jgi:hypothetical protein